MHGATRLITEFVYKGYVTSYAKDKKERGRLTHCFTKLGMVYLREYKHYTFGAVEVINTFKMYHLISIIFIYNF